MSLNLICGWIRLDEWLRRYSSLKWVGSERQHSTNGQLDLSCNVLPHCWFPGVHFTCNAGPERVNIYPMRNRNKKGFNWLSLVGLTQSQQAQTAQRIWVSEDNCCPVLVPSELGRVWGRCLVRWHRRCVQPNPCLLLPPFCTCSAQTGLRPFLWAAEDAVLEVRLR